MGDFSYWNGVNLRDLSHSGGDPGWPPASRWWPWVLQSWETEFCYQPEWTGGWILPREDLREMTVPWLMCSKSPAEDAVEPISVLELTTERWHVRVWRRHWFWSTLSHSTITSQAIVLGQCEALIYPNLSFNNTYAPQFLYSVSSHF